MICGLLAPDGGAARIAGMDVRVEPGRVKALMGYVPRRSPCTRICRRWKMSDSGAALRPLGKELDRRHGRS